MNFDVAMPLTLFAVTMVAVFLDRRVEGKLRSAFEEREFTVRDAVLLVAAMGVVVSLIVFVPQTAVMLLFLSAYSMVLFAFVYLFSGFGRGGARVFCGFFLAASLLAAVVSLFGFGVQGTVAYGALGFFCLFGFAFLALVWEEDRAGRGERLYLAVMAPALFVLLYFFFGGTSLWFPYLLDLFGVVFAVLVVLYMGSFFTWKTSLIFVGLLTVVDVVLVLFTGSMVSAVEHVSGLGVPMLVSVRTVPLVLTDEGVLYMSLGLGDFFVAGLLGVQALRRFGEDSAVQSVAGMALSFFLFEVFMLNYGLTAFPGTLMIVCGWLPVILWKIATSKT